MSMDVVDVEECDIEVVAAILTFWESRSAFRDQTIRARFNDGRGECRDSGGASDGKGKGGDLHGG